MSPDYPTLLSQIKEQNPGFSTDNPELDEIWPLVESSYSQHLQAQVRSAEERIGVIAFALGALAGVVTASILINRGIYPAES